MKTKTILLTAGLLIGLYGVSIAQQPDTSTNPSNQDIFKDPKTTDDHSKVLIDTSTQMVDSLLEAKKSGKTTRHKQKGAPMGESKKPVKIKRSAIDSTNRTVVP